MKVRHIVHGPRARFDTEGRRLMRKGHRATRRFNRNNPQFGGAITMTLAVCVMAQARATKRALARIQRQAKRRYMQRKRNKE